MFRALFGPKHTLKDALIILGTGLQNGEITLDNEVEAIAKAQASPVAERAALAQLVEWQRRKLRLTVDALAEKADIELKDVLAIEKGEGIRESKTVFKLAEALELPAGKLKHLAGLSEERDDRLEQAAVRFVARSAPIEALTPAESDALEEFVRVLGE